MKTTWIAKDKKTGELKTLTDEEYKTSIEKLKNGEALDYEIKVTIDNVYEKNDVKVSNATETNDIKSKFDLSNIKYDTKRIIEKSLSGVKQVLVTNKRKIESGILIASMTAIVLGAGYFGATHEVIVREKNPDNVYDDILELGNPLTIVTNNTMYSNNPNLYWFNNIGIAKEISSYGDDYFLGIISVVYADELMQANLDYNWEILWGFLNKGSFEDYLKENNMTKEDLYHLGLSNIAKYELVINDSSKERN